MLTKDETMNAVMVACATWTVLLVVGLLVTPVGALQATGGGLLLVTGLALVGLLWCAVYFFRHGG